MNDIDAAVLELVSKDADEQGIGLREYCRRYGLVYSSLRGFEIDQDARRHELYGGLMTPDDISRASRSEARRAARNDP